MEKKEVVKSKCVSCGKPTPMCIPITVCRSCRGKIERFLKAQENYENTLMLSRDVKKISAFDSGNEDIDYALDIIGDQVFTIEKQLEWIKNNLVNIQQITKSKVEIQ